MEYGEGPVSEGDQHATFHMSARREEAAAVTEVHTDQTTQHVAVVTEFNCHRHLHQAEHRVFEFDGVEALLPVSNRRVDVEP